MPTSTDTLYAFKLSHPVSANDKMWRGSTQAMAQGVYCTAGAGVCAWCYAHYHGSYMDCHCYPSSSGSKCDWY